MPDMKTATIAAAGVTTATIITLPLLAMIAFSGCHSVYNYTGAHQDKATAEAEEFIAADPALDGATIECKKHDSDHDGDVTCTVHANGERITLECPTRRFIRLLEDHGCKETVRLTGRVK